MRAMRNALPSLQGRRDSLETSHSDQYFVLEGCAGRVSALRELEYRPNIPTLQDHSTSYDGATLRRLVAEEYAVSGEANRKVLGRKARWSGAAVSALYVEAVFLALAAVRTLL